LFYRFNTDITQPELVEIVGILKSIIRFKLEIADKHVMSVMIEVHSADAGYAIVLTINVKAV
jgi:hypothetical protein